LTADEVDDDGDQSSVDEDFDDNGDQTDQTDQSEDSDEEDQDVDMIEGQGVNPQILAGTTNASQMFIPQLKRKEPGTGGTSGKKNHKIPHDLLVAYDEKAPLVYTRLKLVEAEEMPLWGTHELNSSMENLYRKMGRITRYFLIHNSFIVFFFI
jgi:hypothetical protein